MSQHSIDDIVKLPPLAEGILLAATLDAGESDVYTVQAAIDLTGELDLEALREAGGKLLERHEMLRAAVRSDQAGRSWFVTVRGVDLPWRVCEAADEAAAEREERRERELRFDLERPPLLRALLLELGGRQYRLVLTLHHLILDGWSMPVILRDLLAFYHGTESALPQLARYTEYVTRVQAAADPETGELWKARLAACSGPTLLAQEPPGKATAGGAERRLRLDSGITVDDLAGLADWARESGCTFAAAAQVAWGLTLGAELGRTDVVYGTTLSRRRPEMTGFESMVGLFVNTVPVIVAPAAGATLAELCRAQYESMLALDDAADRGLAQIQADLGMGALFDSLMLVENYPLDGVGEASTEGLQITGARVQDSTQYPLTVIVMPGSDVHLDVDPARLAPERAERIARRLCAVVRAMPGSGDWAVAALDLSLPEEPQWRTGHEFGPERRLSDDSWVQRIVHSLQARPDDVVYRGSRRLDLAADAQHPEAVITGSQFLADVAAITEQLRSAAVRPGDTVTVALGRAPRMVAALLAVAWRGAQYVPLDPGYPAERIRQIFDDAQPRVTLVDPVTAPALRSAGAADLLVLSDAGASPAELGECAPRGAQTPAYTIFTSGSTGRPKGVTVPDAAFGNLLDDMARQVGLGPSSRLCAVTPLTFDIAEFELLGTLLAGAETALLDAATVHDLDRLAEAIHSFRPSHLQATPSLWRALAEEHPESIGGLRIVVGGEALPETLAEVLTAGAEQVFNSYGPTETTIWSTTCPLPAGHTGPVPIGRPIALTRALVLDAWLRPCPVGVVGDLYLSGIGLAHGYRGRPELTAVSFVPEPGGPGGARMYRTGDLAKFDAAGVLHYSGRSDFQVKIRGHRVELGEVEAALRAAPQVLEAVAHAHTGADGLRQLVGYVRAAVGVENVSAELLGQLRSALPEYMVPSHIVVLDAMPLTANGKIDRKALPAPEAPANSSSGAVSDGLTDLLQAEFAGALGVDRVGPDEDLFGLGGHSITAARLVSRLRRSTGFDITLDQVFANPTPRSLAAVYRGSAAVGGPALAVRRDGDLAPASRAQRRLWLLAQTGGAADAYHLPFLIRATGKLSVEAFAAALDDLRERHEILRTVIRLDPETGELEQRILANRDLPPTLRGAAAEGSAELRAAMGAGFDLETEAPIRGVLVLDESGEPAAVAVTMHHVAVDATSVNRLLADLDAAYAARTAGVEPELGSARLRYLDLTADEDRDVTEGRWNPGLEFWAAELADAPSELALPFERPRPQVESHRGDIVSVTIPADLAAAAETLARRTGVTMFMLMQGALGVLYRNLGAGEDLPLGTATTARLDLAAEQTVGPFLNTVVLRTRVPGAASFRDVLRGVRRTDVACFAQQAVPFELVLERLAVERNADRHPVFQTYLGYTVEEPAPPAGELRLETLGSDTAKFDLSFEFVETRGTEPALRLHVEYATDLFTDRGAERLAARFVTVLEQLVQQPERPVRAASVMLPQDRVQLAAALTGPETAAPQDVMLRFLEVAEAHRYAKAVIGPDGISLSYRQLAAQAGLLAEELLRQGVGSGDVVAVARETDAQSPACLLAIWAIGAVYLPLDCASPAARIATVLESAQPQAVLSDARFRELLESALAAARSASRVVDLEALPAEPVLGDPLESLAALVGGQAIRPGQAAYLLFTSGSTGKPKGALIHRTGLANHLAAKVDTLALTPDDVVLANAALTFDISLWQLLCALMVGGATAVPPRGAIADPHELWGWAAQQRTTVLEIVPSLLGVAIEAEAAGRPLPEIPGLRRLLLTGEALPADSVRAWLQGHPEDILVNAYGPTECSDDVTHAEFELGSNPGRTTAPIGTALQNTELLVLNDDLQPCPPGVSGELYVAGTGVGIGYLGRPGQTATTFVADPRGGGGRFYRTGDIVLLGEDGLEFKGRREHQVKIRGHRIETAEIEAVAREIPSVLAAAVIAARRSAEHPLELFGYASGQVAVDELTRVMADRLPVPMRPSAWTVLDRLPLTANGKVDLKSLVVPVPEASDQPFEGPRGDVETLVCAIFADVIGVPAVARHDDFFAIGGDSLRSVRVLTALAKAGHSLGLAQIFTHRTPAALAAWLGGAEIAEPDRDGVGSFPVPPEFLRQAQRAGGLEGFDQWIVLAAEEPVDGVRWAAACQAVTGRHDALRLRWDGSSETAEIVAASALGVPRHARGDAAERDAAETGAADIGSAVRAARADLAPLPGELMSTRIVPGPDRDHVVIAVHHLALDAASWEVLVPDLLAAYRSGPGAEVQWPSRPATAYRSWATGLADPEQPWTDESAYWQAVTAGLPPAPLADPAGGRSRTSKIPAATMERLTEAAGSRGISLEPVLLASFCRAVGEARGELPAVVVEVESQGRIPLQPGTDVSGTMGWFTSAFPIRVPLCHEAGASADSARRQIEDSIASVIWARARVPRDGRGYAALLTGRSAEDRPGEAPYAFNYLGQAGAGSSLPGWSLSPRQEEWDEAVPAGLGFELSADALSENDGTLLVSWNWSPSRLPDDLAETVIGYFERWVETTVAALTLEPLPALAPTLPLRNEGEQHPLFVLHGGVGLAWPYMSLLPELPADLPVLGLQADFNRYGPHGEFGIRDLAAAYLHRIRSVQSHGPYRLLGWSFGGLVAHAVAEALEAIGETVEYLGILDAYPLLEAEAIPSEDWVLGQLLRLDTGDALAPKLAGAIRELDYAAIARAWKQHGGGLSDLGEEGLRRVVRVTRAHADMGQRFRPGQVNADIQLVVATLEAETPADPEQSWAAHTRGRVRAIPVPARHDDLLAPDEVRGYADALLAELKGPAHVAS